MKRKELKNGLLNGIPVMLAYLFVSIGFGVLATSANLTVIQSALMSLTNLTSAGQYNGVTLIAAQASIFELIFCQFIINIRYAFMSFSLSQKLDDNYSLFHKLLTSFAITDEIFGIAYSREKKITPFYMYGLGFTPIVGWTAGTIIGAVAGNIFPDYITNALGILLFGMFISIVVKPSRKDIQLLFCVIFSSVLSVICYYFLSFINTGLSVVICALVSSIVFALIFPKKRGDDAI